MEYHAPVQVMEAAGRISSVGVVTVARLALRIRKHSVLTRDTNKKGIEERCAYAIGMLGKGARPHHSL